MVVNFGVQRHAFASVQRLAAGQGVTIHSEDLGKTVTARSSSELPGDQLEFLEAFMRKLVPDGESVLLVTESDVPPGAGLGGSGAMGVAVVAALDHAFGIKRTAAETARLANDVERKDLGYPGGDQDSFGAALGGINKLEYVKGGGTVPHRLDISDEVLHALENRTLLLYTSEAHVSGNIHKDIKESYKLPDSPTVAAMVGLRESAIKMAAALEAGDLDAYAESLNTSCDELYNLHASCGCEGHRQLTAELDDLILGRKTCGAGGGGFLAVFTKPGCRQQCIKRAEQLGALVWPVVLDRTGVTTWSDTAAEKELVESIIQRAR